MPVGRFNIAANQRLTQPGIAALKGRGMRLGIEKLEQEIDIVPAQEKRAEKLLKIQEAEEKRLQKAQKIATEKWLEESDEKSREHMENSAVAGLQVFADGGTPEEAAQAIRDNLPSDEENQLPDDFLPTEQFLKNFIADVEEYRIRERDQAALVNMYNPETGERIAVRPDSPEADEAAANGFLVGGTSKELLGLDADSLVGQLKSADEGYILRMVSQHFGGLLTTNEAGEKVFTILDPDMRRKASQVTEAAAAHFASGAAKTRSEAVKMGMKAYGEKWEEPPHSIGDIIEKGGKKYEVIGFFEDGEPEVKEIA